jgi:hypothetical protein
MHASFLGLAVCLMFAAACGRATAPASGSTPPSASSSSADAPLQVTPAVEGGDEDGHEHAAPHGGTLVELGEEFAHLEILLDASTGTLTAYALDGEAERAVRLTQSSIALSLTPPVLSAVEGPGGLPNQVTLTGVSNALTGETAADTSQFSATVPALKGITAFEGSIKAVVVRGQQFHDVAFRYPSTGHE